MTSRSSWLFGATGLVAAAFLHLVGTASGAQDFLDPVDLGERFGAAETTVEGLRYDFFSAALSCPVTRGMDTVGGRFFENNAIVTYPFKPYLVCSGVDFLTLPPNNECDAYCPIPRNEARVPSSLAKVEVQLRDESQGSNRVVGISVCGQNHVGETVCASVTKNPPTSGSTSHQILTMEGSELDPIRQLSDAHTLYLHVHQVSAWGSQPMDFVNWAVYWDEN